MTQRQASIATSLDRAAISRIECGERAPDLRTLRRLCTGLETHLRDLLDGIGPRQATPRDPARRSSGPPAVTFGENLKRARVQADISQELLALGADVDRAAISVYENGRREPNLRTVLKLAIELEIPPYWLLDGVL